MGMSQVPKVVFFSLSLWLNSSMVSAAENCRNVFNEEAGDIAIFSQALPLEKLVIQRAAKVLMNWGADEPSPYLTQHVLKMAAILETTGMSSNKVRELVRIRLMDHLLLPLSEGLGLLHPGISFTEMAEAIPTQLQHTEHFYQKWNLDTAEQVFYKNIVPVDRPLNRLFLKSKTEINSNLKDFIPLALKYDLHDVLRVAIGVDIAQGFYDEVAYGVVKANPQRIPERNEILFLVGQFALVDYFSGLRNPRYNQRSLETAIFALGAVKGGERASYSRALLQDLSDFLMKRTHSSFVLRAQEFVGKVNVEDLPEIAARAHEYSQKFIFPYYYFPDNTTVELIKEGSGPKPAMPRTYFFPAFMEKKLREIIRTGNPGKLELPSVGELNTSPEDAPKLSHLPLQVMRYMIFQSTAHLDHQKLVEIAAGIANTQPDNALIAIEAAILVRSKLGSLKSF